MILYKLVAGIFKLIRLIMPKPGSVLKAIGLIGVALGYIINYLILKPIRYLAYAFCGLLIYQKGANHPVVGAIGYMLFFVLFVGVTMKLISLVI